MEVSISPTQDDLFEPYFMPFRPPPPRNPGLCTKLGFRCSMGSWRVIVFFTRVLMKYSFGPPMVPGPSVL